tara:strand:- start:360 stop:596 length:237 start_codon:yes stop_codon:yes gene_type:complete
VYDKIVKKFKKGLEERWVGFGTYDINYLNGATRWIGVSGKDDHVHMILLDKLQSQSDFIKLPDERGETENIKDYMVGD